MKKFFSILLFLIGTSHIQAQVGIGTKTPHASAMLEVTATNKGILIPRMTLAQRNAIKSPANSLMIYQTDNIPGYYYYASNSWTRIANGNSSGGASNTFTAPLTLSGTTVSIPQANATTNGFLSAADWSKFNKVENGTNTGDMLYWNGSSWVKLPIGSDDQTLVICGGMPVWGGCLATVLTSSISDMTATTATAGGTLTKTGGTAILDKGIVWSTTANPTISLTTKKSFGAGTESFSGTINGLEPSTVYYARAYATNNKGTSYGNEVSFTTTAVDLTTGLVAYYPFNDNANDESGNGNHGTVNGAELTTDRFGNANKSYNFNGINNYINIPFSSSLNTIQKGLTMSAWIYMDGGTGSGTPPRVLELRGAYGGGGDAGFVMLAQSNSNVSRTFEVRWHNNFGNTNISISPTSGVSALSWHLITFTCDGSTAIGKFYLDGTLINTNSNMPLQGVISSCNYNNNPLIIGAEPNQLGKWGGKIDEVRIYNRALNQSEITYLATH